MRAYHRSLSRTTHLAPSHPFSTKLSRHILLGSQVLSPSDFPTKLSYVFLILSMRFDLISLKTEIYSQLKETIKVL